MVAAALLRPRVRREGQRDPIRAAGRWCPFRVQIEEAPEPEFVARVLLRRYGVVFRSVLERERIPVDMVAGASIGSLIGGLWAAGQSAEELEKMVKNIPAGYIGELSDAVAAALFLLSEEARYVNGANLQLSGGWGL